MTNILKMVKDTVMAQKNLKKMQNDLKSKTVQYSGAGGRIIVTACGDASLAGIKIDPEIVDPNRTGELEKLMLQTVNGALEEAKKMSAAHMQDLMADMGLPKIPGLSL